MEKIEDIWLCSLCVKDTKLWQKEDFDFEEEDRDANTVGTVKGKSKSANAKPKRNSIDLITLSSDEEEEDDDDEEDEVEFLAEMEGHFFGNQDTSEVKTNLQSFAMRHVLISLFQAEFSEAGDAEDPFGDISDAEISEVTESSDDFDAGEVMIVS